QVGTDYINPDRWYYHSFGYESFGTGTGLTRAKAGVDANDIVIVTAGNRLKRELSQEFAGIIAQALRAQPRVRWMILGVQDKAEIVSKLGLHFNELADRILFKGYVSEIG